jgi:hypothetical protein
MRNQLPGSIPAMIRALHRSNQSARKPSGRFQTSTAL